MEEEKIIQKANEYYESIDTIVLGYDNNSIIEAFIAGAHSRDKELDRWKKSRLRLRLRLQERIYILQMRLKDYAEALLAEDKKLIEPRSPWISVLERLPDIAEDGMSEIVLLSTVQVQDGVTLAWYCNSKRFQDEWHYNSGGHIVCLSNNPDLYWMTIPKLEGGEK